MRNLTTSTWRYWLIATGISLCFVAVVARLWYVQVYTGDRYRRAADENRSMSETYPASRGKIVDSRGNVLAQNREVFSLRGDQELLTNEDREKFPEIAKLLKISEEELREKLEPPKSSNEGPNRYVLLQEDVSEATARAVVALLPRTVIDAKGGKMPRSYFPIKIERKFVRTYPLGKRAAHIIGYINRENKSVQGIELALNRFLKGEDGWREGKRDGKRREQPRMRSRDVPARDGYTVQLTLDSSIQGFAEDACEKIVRELTPISASIIVSEAKTGKILALANAPTFDLNKFNTEPTANQRNRALTDIYEPGSVFKIVSVAAALEEGVVTENSVFDCAKTSVPYRGKMRRLPREDHEMARLSVREIIEQSSNRGTAQIAMKFCEKFGEEAYVDYIRKFGFGEKSYFVGGFGEQRGIVHRPKNWDGLTITRLPMGHAVSVTPLQAHYAMSVIASGGILHQPRIVERIIDEQNKNVLSYPSAPRRRVISEKTAKLLAGMLRGAVADIPQKRNTGKKADIPGYNVAGKTGTTQKIKETGGYYDDFYVVSFSGFFPAENPRIVITVVVDGPRYQAERWVAKRDSNGRVMYYPNGTMMMEKKVLPTRAYGGTVAAPVFREVAEKVIGWLEIPKSRED
ncbi:MAG: penicillin-binding protein 2 [Opitutales bacterium]|nr:penicillin-binding protein 2 [Opitutales bacterium]